MIININILICAVFYNPDTFIIDREICFDIFLLEVSEHVICVAACDKTFQEYMSLHVTTCHFVSYGDCEISNSSINDVITFCGSNIYKI